MLPKYVVEIVYQTQAERVVLFPRVPYDLQHSIVQYPPHADTVDLQTGHHTICIVHCYWH